MITLVVYAKSCCGDEREGEANLSVHRDGGEGRRTPFSKRREADKGRGGDTLGRRKEEAARSQSGPENVC